MSAQAELIELRDFVAGEPVDAVQGATVEVVSPATGEVVGRVSNGTQADVDRAVAAASAARRKWGETTPRERSERLHALADVIEQHAEELARLDSLDAGKPLPQARGEMGTAVDALRFFAGAARTVEGLAAGEYKAGHTSMIRVEPVGVVGQIGAWNFPLIAVAWKAGPALAAGNTVVYKPAEQTPLSALRLAELAADVFPPGVLNVIAGDGPTVGAGIAGHPDVRLVSVTGDVGTGKAVAGAAARTLARTHLELGGKSPVIVFDDADPAEVAQAIRMAGYFNSGQDCTAASRVLAGPKVYERLLEELAPAVSSIKVGEPEEAGVEMGSVISARHQERVTGFVERAVDAGAEVVVGGGIVGERGFYVEPTVLAGVAQSDEIVQNEVFGPVVTVQRFADPEEAFALAHDVRYGLAASVWTHDLDLALDAARRLEFGTVWVNNHMTFLSELPHGGFRDSGYGKEMSVYALHEYSQVKQVTVRFGRT